MAQIRERAKEVIVLRRIEWMKVVLVPFQMPQAPSVAQRCESVVVIEDREVRD